MDQDKKAAKPSQQDPEQGNEVDPRLKEPYGPEGYRSGVDEPGVPTSKNPGQTNPARNTPGKMRQDEPGQQDKGKPGQDQTMSYPGVKGPEALELQEHGVDGEVQGGDSPAESDRGEPQGDDGDSKNVGTARRNEQSARDGALELPKE